MISTETLQGTVRIHAVKSLIAEAGPEDKSFREQVSWLTIKTNIGDEVVFFMPYETAQAYASVINTCNDQEAVENHGSNNFSEVSGSETSNAG